VNVILCPEDRAFIDSETTGLDPYRHVIWEFAAILRDSGFEDLRGDEEMVWQIRPTDAQLADADPEALAISGFKERFKVRTGWQAARIDPDGGAWNLTLNEAVFEIQEALCKRALIGANTGFDDAMLRGTLKRLHLRVRWHFRLVCVQNMAAGRLGLDLPQSLSKTAELLGVPSDPEVAHTALGDARLARDIYDTLTNA
jgi:DNA polymerase III epsilon subunit-like protein